MSKNNKEVLPILIIVAIVAIVGLVGLAMVNSSITGHSADDDYDKVTICHIPEGNLDAAQTIKIDDDAVNKHFKKNPDDYYGQCVTSGSSCPGNEDGFCQECSNKVYHNYLQLFVDADVISSVSSSSNLVSLGFSIVPTLFDDCTFSPVRILWELKDASNLSILENGSVSTFYPNLGGYFANDSTTSSPSRGMVITRLEGQFYCGNKVANVTTSYASIY